MPFQVFQLIVHLFSLCLLPKTKRKRKPCHLNCMTQQDSQQSNVPFMTWDDPHKCQEIS